MATPPEAPSSAPQNGADIESRVQEVLGTQNVTVERLRQLRDMLQNVDRGKLPRQKELLARVQERLDALKQNLASGSETPEQAQLRLELQGLQDRLAALESPSVIERAGGVLSDKADEGKQFLGETVAAAPSIVTNYFGRVSDEFKKHPFNGVMAVAVPLLSAVGIGILAKKALQKPKSILGRIMVGILGVGGLIALTNYAGKKAQAESIDRQARRPVAPRVQEIIDSVNNGSNVDVNDPRLIDVDLFQLRGAPITVGGHSVRLERTTNSGRPVIRLAVGGSTFELGALPSLAIQSVTRRRGMLDVAVLLGITTSSAFVTDAEFARIAGELSGATVNKTVEFEYFTDPTKPEEKQKRSALFTYVQPAASAPVPTTP
ncbi:hypothetical protein COU78_05915 [Candidatus Peregrinibacteria bacterium CG10_big_fil_rev_8_21_14_0_10_49_24]|nr:MAG: hypothetical protein COV83_04620 [Candidatus Peregrinibacteria bacterium CG11_big_fil_rev_8_21_14_0_20_49_14]PIR50557.1 MAG: hypothetical protein COU78_05915 [Candidatus Peregrinibacteria bacterium CG10_big_fil_rev_8_21_14_0_10_49_24]PJA67927.1 MAG: hypothetical protein CO157_02085 [Candidatus Peregrinibacteria bacterium CG_4_9_14_3_um_filter_49_12]